MTRRIGYVSGAQAHSLYTRNSLDPKDTEAWKYHYFEAVLTSTLHLCFEQKFEKYQIILSENFHFLVVKFSIYLNRHVFIRESTLNERSCFQSYDNNCTSYCVSIEYYIIWYNRIE